MIRIILALFCLLVLVFLLAVLTVDRRIRCPFCRSRRWQRVVQLGLTPEGRGKAIGYVLQCEHGHEWTQ